LISQRTARLAKKSGFGTAFLSGHGDLLRKERFFLTRNGMFRAEY
jgi:hypothetical protein